MKTDRPEPRLDLSPLEWRLLLTAGLASTYLLAWFAVQPSLQDAATPPPSSRQSAAARDDVPYVWLADIPPSRRPTVRLPVGWAVAGPVAREPTPHLVRTPRSLPVRIRTRSS